MTWDYRILVRNGEDAIYEVYDDESGHIEACTDTPAYPTGDSTEALREDLEHYQRARKHPVLDYDKLSKQTSGFQTSRRGRKEVKGKASVV